MLALLISALVGWKSHEKLSAWVPARAEVVEVVKRKSAAAVRSYYYPRFRFTAQDGQVYTVISSDGARRLSRTHAVEDEMDIIYPADNPAKAIPDSFFSHYLVPCIVAVVSALMAVLGGILLVVARRLKNNPNPPDLNVGEVDLPSGVWLTGGEGPPITHHRVTFSGEK